MVFGRPHGKADVHSNEGENEAQVLDELRHCGVGQAVGEASCEVGKRSGRELLEKLPDTMQDLGAQWHGPRDPEGEEEEEEEERPAVATAPFSPCQGCRRGFVPWCRPRTRCTRCQKRTTEHEPRVL